MSVRYQYAFVTPLASLMSFFGRSRLRRDPDLGQDRHGVEPDEMTDHSPARRTITRALLGVRAARGQVLIVFATSILLFLLLCAAVVDMSWYWTNNLRMQRAADAAALAGVVFLPGDPATARHGRPAPRPPRTATRTAPVASPSRRPRTRATCAAST